MWLQALTQLTGITDANPFSDTISYVNSTPGQVGDSQDMTQTCLVIIPFNVIKVSTSYQVSLSGCVSYARLSGIKRMDLLSVGEKGESLDSQGVRGKGRTRGGDTRRRLLHCPAERLKSFQMWAVSERRLGKHLGGKIGRA